MADLILSGVDSVLNLHNRKEDLEQRKINNVYREVADARRQVDLKAQQLKAISNLSALVGGFAMVVLVEGQIDQGLNEGLLMAFGAVTAAVVGFMLMAMINCSLILLHVLDFPAKENVIARANGQRDVDTFEFFWQTRCEDDWRSSYKAFRMGVSFFVVSLALLGWVKFHDSVWSAGLVTAVAVCCSLYWLLHTKSKWNMPASTKERAGAAKTDVGQGVPESKYVPRSHRPTADASGSSSAQPPPPPAEPTSVFVPRWKREQGTRQ